MENMEYAAARLLFGRGNGEPRQHRGSSGGVSCALGVGIFRRQSYRLQWAKTHRTPGFPQPDPARRARPHTLDTLSPPPPPPHSTSARGQMVAAVARCRCVWVGECVFSCLGWERRRGREEEKGVPAVLPFPFLLRHEGLKESRRETGERKNKSGGSPVFSISLGNSAEQLQSHYHSLTFSGVTASAW